MKKILISLILILLSLLVQAQKQDAHFTIDCDHYVSLSGNNEQLCIITERCWSAIAEKYSFPKDSLGNNIRYMNAKLKNLEIVPGLVREIFTNEEMEILKKRRFYVWFLMNDNGEICSIQYNTIGEYNIEPYLKGFEELANSFKEKLIWEVEFYPEVAQSGIFTYGFKVFDDRIWVE